jgi:hypothetical protein
LFFKIGKICNFINALNINQGWIHSGNVMSSKQNMFINKHMYLTKAGYEKCLSWQFHFLKDNTVFWTVPIWPSNKLLLTFWIKLTQCQNLYCCSAVTLF